MQKRYTRAHLTHQGEREVGRYLTAERVNAEGLPEVGETGIVLDFFLSCAYGKLCIAKREISVSLIL